MSTNTPSPIVKKISAFIIFFFASFGSIFLIRYAMDLSTNTREDIIYMIILAIIMEVNVFFILPWLIKKLDKKRSD